MKITPKPSTPAQLTTAAVAYLTSPANTTTIIKSATICNTTGTARTYTVHRVPAAGAASAVNMVISARAIAPNTTDTIAEMLGKVLLPGEMVMALSDAGAALSVDFGIAEVVGA